ncbi:conserved hypothetical protein [Sphingomonas sp. EC-HK361]|nr:conserved hypothetical protein [Sphingomonas sp. EC-HK361]
MSRVLPFDRRVVLRPVSDGAGPSHLIAIGEYLLVIDPWASEIRRYSAANIDAPPHVVTFPRSFAPWRTRWDGDDVQLISEPFGGEDCYDFRPRSSMTIAQAMVEVMPLSGVSAFPITPWRGPDDGASTPSFIPLGGDGAEICALRRAGSLSDGRSLWWWSEIDGSAHDIARGGRVSAPHFVGVFDRDGSGPVSTVQIVTATYGPLAPNSSLPNPSLLVKPGFEYLAATDDTLWIVAADTAAIPAFNLLACDLSELAPGEHATLSLVDPHASAVDRDNPVHSAPPPVVVTIDEPPAGPRDAWFRSVRDRLRAQATHAWAYPEGAAARPCGGADRCIVGADASGALGSGEAFSTPVGDKIDGRGGAEWMRPRDLIDARAGETFRGIPYSIGGFDLVETFDVRLADTYRAGSPALPPPIGHIREGLEWPDAAANYPLGIDCSALVARIFGIRVRSTAEMVAPRRLRLSDGRFVEVPHGPDHGCAEPVRHLREILPGDVLLREGHIVIYSEAMPVPGGWAMRVFEASSRTGRVGESVYDPSFFDGWWILRVRLEGSPDCPQWIEAALTRS